MLTSNKKYLSYGFCLVSLFVGIYLGSVASIWLFEHYSMGAGREISIEINPFEIISLIVNVLLVVFILRIFQKNDDLEKIEKGLIVENLKKFEENFSTFLKVAIPKSNKLVLRREEIVNRMKRFRMEFESLLTISTQGSVFKEDSFPLKENISNIYAELTDKPESEGFLKFDSSSTDKLATLNYIFHKLMFEYLVKVIKSDR